MVKSQYVPHILQNIAIRFWNIVSALRSLLLFLLMKGHSFKYFTGLSSLAEKIVQPVLTVELGLKKQLREMLGKSACGDASNKHQDSYNEHPNKCSR